MRTRRVVSGLCGLLLGLGGGAAALASGPTPSWSGVAVRLAAPGAREAIARVAYAEAANQGDSGLLAVVYTILNRLADRRWGTSVEQVVNARAQFEPVLRAGGDWRALPPAGPAQRARIDTLINLVLEGRVPDLTDGALYFQNPTIVAARAAAGQAPGRRVHFGGRAPSVVIGDHAFYRDAAGAAERAAPARAIPAPDLIFAPEAEAIDEPPAARPGRGIFILPSGQAVESRR